MKDEEVSDELKYFRKRIFDKMCELEKPLDSIRQVICLNMATFRIASFSLARIIEAKMQVEKAEKLRPEDEADIERFVNEIRKDTLKYLKGMMEEDKHGK